MVHVVNDCGDEQCEEVQIFKVVLQLQHPDEGVGHLSDAKAVIVVVEWHWQIAAVYGADPVVKDIHIDV